MNKKTIICLIFILCINIYPVFARDYETVKITNFRVEPPAGTDQKSRQIKGLSSDLDRLYKLYAGNREYQQFARQSDLQLIEDRVVVTILTKPGITTADLDENNLKAFGSRIQAKAKHSMRVEIPISELENVAAAIKELGVICPPIKPVEHAVTSQGVVLMNADEWQSWGYEGSGVKVAVIDGGFDSLTEAWTSGDIPSSYVSYDFTGSGLQYTTPHGTAVTEAIFDLVPEAEFYLFKIADQTDFEMAKDSCIKYDIDIINHSMGWYNASYYDGTGDICDVANDAISNGITWVNSAGNEAQYHYRSVFYDDGSGAHDFSGSGGNINYFGTSGLAYDITAGSSIVVWLNWDAYPNTREDYDLYLYYYNGSSWILVDSSTNNQTDSVYPYPNERIIHETGYEAPYGVLVREDSTTTDYDFTLFSNRIAPFNYRTASSSITDPGTATDVVTVGAINRTVYNNPIPTIEYFSSRGPTTDDTIKPDVAAPDGCSSFTYRNQPGGYWYGTSLSSPHTAGVCALIKSRFSGYSNSDIRNYLYNNCTVDLGTSGKDNTYGWGKVVMPDISLTVTSPDSGEIWQVGSSHDITWTSSGSSGGVQIEYSTNNGSSWTEEIASTLDDGIYSWTIPDAPSDSCLVRITDTIGSPSDTSDAVFKIFSTPFITLGSPNGGEIWQAGSSHDITWTSGATSGSVRIEYSTNNGSSWLEEIASTLDDGIYSWTIPDAPSDSCFVRVTDTDGSPSDTSDAWFRISPTPNITVTSPNGGENWGENWAHYITWSSSNTSGKVKIEYSTDNGNSWIEEIASTTDNGTYSWTTPSIASETPLDSCLVRVTDTTGSPSDTSDSLFTIYPIYIRVVTPNGGESWLADSTYDITWNSYGTIGKVQIEYSINNGTSWSDIIASIPDTGAYSWIIPDTPSDSCLVRITDTIGSPSDTSDAIFTISPLPFITVGSPNGGEIWYIDSTYDITWTSGGTSGFLFIEYSIDSGTTWLDVTQFAAADSETYSWTIPNTPSNICFIKIADSVPTQSPSDTSDAVFEISPAPYITITSPNGGENWRADSIYDITWITNLTTEDVLIEYSTDNGANWSEIITGVQADTLAYPWTIPDNPSDSCLVRIAATTGSPSDTSDAIFTISPASGVPVSQIPRAYSMIAKTITVGNQLEINYELPEKSDVKFEIYDTKGTKIKEVSKEHTPGFYSIKIGMIDKPTGVYFLTMEANKKKFIKSQKVILVK